MVGPPERPQSFLRYKRSIEDFLVDQRSDLGRALALHTDPHERGVESKSRGVDHPSASASIKSISVFAGDVWSHMAEMGLRIGSSGRNGSQSVCLRHRQC